MLKNFSVKDLHRKNSATKALPPNSNVKLTQIFNM